MALKDWKKVTISRVSTRDLEYLHIKTGKRLLIIKMYSGDYLVDVGYGRPKTINKPRFKTKTQALKFARAYMRKH